MALPRKLECFGIIRKNWNDTEKISMAPAQYALPSKPLGVSDLDDTQKSRMYHFLGLLHMESNPGYYHMLGLLQHGIEPIPWNRTLGIISPLCCIWGLIHTESNPECNIPPLVEYDGVACRMSGKRLVKGA